MSIKHLIFVIVLIIYGMAISGLCESNTRAKTTFEALPFITVDGDKFVDPDGRQVIPHGINISEKRKSRNYLSWHGPEQFAMMREWGFNCIRLVIIWAGVEPEPGVYDDEYLAEIDKRIQWAKENGIYVLLDMHQDLYSEEFGGDGAPEWAIIDDGKPHTPGATWGMTYYTSEAVNASFDNFWANEQAPDGIGLQEHFALAWQHVAQRYAYEPTVIGYDLFNEPFPGSITIRALIAKIQDMLIVYNMKYDEDISIFELVNVFFEPESERSQEIIQIMLNDNDLLKAFADGGAGILMEFDRNVLMPFYNRLAQTVRQVDKNHIIFIETNMMGNFGTPSGISPIVDLYGYRDPLQAFAPHAYDILTDISEKANTNAEILGLIFSRHEETAEKLGMPTIIGEWGGLYNKINALTAAQIVSEQIEKYLFGDTYWSYGSSVEMDEAPYFPTIMRPYPAAIAGKLLSHKADIDNKTFICSWKEDTAITSPGRIYIPDQWFAQAYQIQLEPFSEGWYFEPTNPGSSNGYLIIPPSGGEIQRTLEIGTFEQAKMISMKPGWNLISLPFNKCFYEDIPPTNQPDNVELVNIRDMGFESLCDWLNFIITSEKQTDRIWDMVIGPGGAMDSSLDKIFHSLKYISPCLGYQIKINEDAGGAFITLNGPIFESRNPMQLREGWNLVGYPLMTGYYDSNLPPAGKEMFNWIKVDVPAAFHIFSGVSGKYDMVMNDAGAYNPELPTQFNSLHYISPASAYWIKMNQSASLLYPFEAKAAPSVFDVSENQVLQSLPFMTNRNCMLVYGKIETDGFPAAGTKLQVYSEDRILCGESVVNHQGNYGIMLIYGDDETTPQIEGAKQNEVLAFFANGIRLIPSNSSADPNIYWIGNRLIQQVDFIQQKSIIPSESILKQNYPNPFNPDTWIPYQLDKEAYVVIRIYTSSGQLIRTLDMGRKGAGFYNDKNRAAYWDGKNEFGESTASGIYFYSIEAGEFREIGKMLLVK